MIDATDPKVREEYQNADTRQIDLITDEVLYELATKQPMRYMRFVTKEMLIKYT